MADIDRSTAAGILSPETIQQLVVEPLTRQSVGTQVSTVVNTTSMSTRFPIVTSDASAGWTAEGHEIDISDPGVDELNCVPAKLAALVVASNELIYDSDPSALDVIGQSITRDLQIKLDAAFFGTTVTNGPNGLGSLSGVQHVDAGSAFDDLDPFAEALSKLETVDSFPTRSFVAHPNTLLALSELKVADDWNLPLLGPDATSPTKRSILGVPVYWSPAVDEWTVWLVSQAKSFVVMRQPTSLVVDNSAYFSSDRVGIRCTTRVSFAWPHEAAVVKIGVGGS